MAPEADLIAFASREAMAARVADVVETELARGISEDGRGYIAASGGSTPEALYGELAGRQIRWGDVQLTLVDERWAPLDHPRSNEAFIRKSFRGAPDDIVGLYLEGACPEDAVRDVERRIVARSRDFDVVILGMGADGHTASWFPHARGLDVALSSDQPVCAIHAQKSDVTGEETARMTLTLSAVRGARRLFLLIAGEEKRMAFEKAREPGPVEEMPVRAILNARPDIWICWAP